MEKLTHDEIDELAKRVGERTHEKLLELLAPLLQTIDDLVESNEILHDRVTELELAMGFDVDVDDLAAEGAVQRNPN